METPSQKQAEVYRLILNHVELFGYQPSYAEIARVLGVSKRAVIDRLRQLEAKGLVRLPGRKERAVQFFYVAFKAKAMSDKEPNPGVWGEGE